MDCGLVHLLGVNPAIQDQGVGTLLLENLASTMEVPAILYATTTKNRDFHVRKGYVERGHFKMLEGIVDAQGWLVINGSKTQLDQVEVADREDTTYLMIRPSRHEKSSRGSEVNGSPATASSARLVELLARCPLK